MLIYRSRIFDLHSTSVASRQMPLEYLEHPGTCAALVLNSKNEVGLIAHHRPAAGRTFFELPSLVCPAENPEQALCEELRRETKLTIPAKQLERLTSLYSTPGYSTEKITIYLARTPFASDALRWFSFRELNGLIHSEELVDLKTVAAITAYQTIFGQDQAPEQKAAR